MRAKRGTAATGRKENASWTERAAVISDEFEYPFASQGSKRRNSLRSGWRIVSFGDVVDILDSRRLPVNSEERAKRVGDVPYYGATGQVGFIDKHIFDEELVLLGEDGAPFLDSGKPKAYMIRGKSWVNNHAHVLRGKPGLLNAFLLYQLNNVNYRPYVSGTTRLKLPQGPMKQIPLVVPAEAEQKRIVTEIEKQFTRLDAGVAALRRVQANLKRYRTSVLKSAYEGRLVPTESELAKTRDRKSKFETGEIPKGVGASVGCDPQHQSGHTTASHPPLLPTGWEWMTIPDLTGDDGIFIDGDWVESKDQDPSGDVRLIQLADVGDGVYRNKSNRFMTTGKADQLRCTLLRQGDVLIARMPDPLGRACIFPGDAKPAVTVVDVAIVRAGDGEFDHRWLTCFVNAHPFRSAISALQAGSTRKRISRGNLATIPLPVPRLPEQRRIVAEVERRLSVVEELEAVVSSNLRRATRLRQSILQKAFAGELVANELTIKQTNIVALPSVKLSHRPNAHFLRAVLSGEIVHRLHNEPTFGRVKHLKIFNLCEHIAQLEELKGEYHREAAGPLDNKLIYANVAELKKQKWYQEVDRDSRHMYVPLARAGAHRTYLERYWPKELPTIEKLIELMRHWDTEGCEIFSTAYAAWNDLIIWGKPATEAAILHEILERWHEKKKRIPKERWLKVISWMKEAGFVPTGFGTPTADAPEAPST